MAILGTSMTSTLTNLAKNTPYVRKWAVQKTDTTILLYAHYINDQGGLL